jgi:hypothetical protein
MPNGIVTGANEKQRVGSASSISFGSVESAGKSGSLASQSKASQLKALTKRIKKLHQRLYRKLLNIGVTAENGI